MFELPDSDTQTPDNPIPCPPGTQTPDNPIPPPIAVVIPEETPETSSTNDHSSTLNNG